MRQRKLPLPRQGKAELLAAVSDRLFFTVTSYSKHLVRPSAAKLAGSAKSAHYDTSKVWSKATRSCRFSALEEGQLSHTMDDIDRLAAEYARRRDLLGETVDKAQAAVDAAKRAHRAALRRRTGAAANARADLLAALEAVPKLFQRPRTRLLNGIKVGWRKRPGRIEIEDEASTIAAIRTKLGDAAAEQLIQVREKVVRGALRALPARDLLRIGAAAVEAVDEPFAQPADSEIDKLVDALLDGAEDVEEEAA